MSDIEKLLLKAATKGLVVNLSRNGIGMADFSEEGIHYYLNGEEYLITCQKVKPENKEK